MHVCIVSLHLIRLVGWLVVFVGWDSNHTHKYNVLARDVDAHMQQASAVSWEMVGVGAAIISS
jgi:hypothetical protein